MTDNTQAMRDAAFIREFLSGSLATAPKLTKALERLESFVSVASTNADAISVPCANCTDAQQCEACTLGVKAGKDASPASAAQGNDNAVQSSSDLISRAQRYCLSNRSLESINLVKELLSALSESAAAQDAGPVAIITKSDHKVGISYVDADKFPLSIPSGEYPLYLHPAATGADLAARILEWPSDRDKLAIDVSYMPNNFCFVSGANGKACTDILEEIEMELLEDEGDSFPSGAGRYLFDAHHVTTDGGSYWEFTQLDFRGCYSASLVSPADQGKEGK